MVVKVNCLKTRTEEVKTTLEQATKGLHKWKTFFVAVGGKQGP